MSYDDQALALEKLRHGEISGVMDVVGKPAQLFQNIPQNSGLHFIDVAVGPRDEGNYKPATLSSAEYPNLVDKDRPVTTLATPTVLAAFNWPSNSPRYGNVALFCNAFLENFPEFLHSPRHPKWRDVDLFALVPGWRRFPAAEEWIREHPNSHTVQTTEQFSSSFEDFAKQTGFDATHLSQADRDAIFHQFIDRQRKLNHQ